MLGSKGSWSWALAFVSQVVLLVLCGCSKGEHRAPRLDDVASGAKGGSTRRDARAPTGGATGADAASDASTPDAGDAGNAVPDAGTSSDGGAGTANCGESTCRGHGRCVETAFGDLACVCDDGYVAEGEDDAVVCVVDKGCKKIRYLEEASCRQSLDEPAVAMYFAVDYCAGTAVLPEDLGDLNEAFVVLENGRDIRDNEESVATVIERGVESYLAIAIDVSDSVTGVSGDKQKAEALSELVAQIRTFVHSLQPAPGSPPVSISILVFGRFVAEYVPFTTDVAELDAALETLEKEPERVVSLVRGEGTALYQAVERSVQAVERVRALRHLVTEGGVLTTGTAVVISDGRDSSNAKLNAALIQNTRVNVISVGISSDIDDEDLGAIGRDGSFLAPTPADWAEAFGEIAERVAEYPDRTYLLAYCTSATTGDATVSVDLSAFPARERATCKFNADQFPADVTRYCNLDLFKDFCADEGYSCGTFVACGACPGDSCCADGQCEAPSTIEDASSSDNIDCYFDNTLCAADGLVCARNLDQNVMASSTCQQVLAVDEPCDPASSLCQPGVTYCDSQDRVCTPVAYENGEMCGTSAEHPAYLCPELNCARRAKNDTSEPFTCQPQARIFDNCSQEANAVCEPGAYCLGACQPRKLTSCTLNAECKSGVCDSETKRCVNTHACYWDWQSVIPSAP